MNTAAITSFFSPFEVSDSVWKAVHLDITHAASCLQLVFVSPKFPGPHSDCIVHSCMCVACIAVRVQW